MKLPQLNLPPIRAVVSTDGPFPTILDPLRNKMVALTPEEWVRQHFAGWLVSHKGYPATLIANEIGLKINGRQRRADTIVYSRDLTPLAVIEYKNAGIAISQKTFDQIVRYNMIFQAPCVMVSNGLTHYCCAIDFTTRTYRFLESVPDYEALAALLAPR